MRGAGLNSVRHVVQAAIWVLFCTPPALAAVLGWRSGEGLFYGTLASSTLFQELVLADPLAVLQILSASRALPALGMVLSAGAVLLFYALIGGRVFCGWVCPVHALVELTGWLRKKTLKATRLHTPKTGIRVPPRATKIIVCVGVLALSALIGLPVFELVSPVNAVFRLAVIGAGIGFWTLVAVVLTEALFGGRVWCRAICPLGGLYEAVGRVGVFRVVRTGDGGGCSRCLACKRACLADPEILDPLIYDDARRVRSGDCLLCGVCVGSCPQRILSIRPGVPLGGSGK